MDFYSNRPTQAFGEGGFTGAQDQTPQTTSPAPQPPQSPTFTPAQQNIPSLTSDLGFSGHGTAPPAVLPPTNRDPATPQDLGPGFAQAGQTSSAGALPAGHDFYNTPTSSLDPNSWMAPQAQSAPQEGPNPVQSLIQLISQLFQAQSSQPPQAPPQGSPTPPQTQGPNPQTQGHDLQQRMQRQQALFAAPGLNPNPYGTGIPQPHRIANADNAAYGDNGQLGLEDLGNSGLSGTDQKYLAGLSFYYNPQNYQAWQNALNWGVPGIPPTFPGSPSRATYDIPVQQAPLPDPTSPMRT